MKYIFIFPYGAFDFYMYQDLFETKEVIPFQINYPYRSRLLSFCRKIHRSQKINKFIHLPFRDIWDRKLFQQIENNTCIIFNTVDLALLQKNFFYKLKFLHKNVKLALFIVDSLHGSSGHIATARDNILNFPWDVRMSYDKNDCKEFGFEYLGPNIYSRMTNVSSSDFTSDLYFIGSNKSGRNNDIISLYEKCIAQKVKTNFNLIDTSITNIKRKNQSNKTGLIFSSHNIPYEKVISEVLSTNCILEYVAKGQKVQTARYYEAVCYNKKLLTNNPSVKELQFYDPRYIQYFETIDDIDFDWVKKKEKIDYHYNGEFSPIHALEKLKRLLGDNDEN